MLFNYLSEVSINFLILLQLPNSPMMTPIRLANERKPNNISTYARIRPKPPQLPMGMANCSYNGFGASPNFGVNIYNPISDNINLSLESLTQVNII